MSAPIQFSRTPYIVQYYKDGEKKTIRRVPPPLLHNMLPTDVVKLNQDQSADFRGGNTYTVKNINPRQPNTLQIENKDGETRFVPYFDLELQERIAPRDGESEIDTPYRNQYLTWP